jgi:exodeoxyribonuclease VII small subunit
MTATTFRDAYGVLQRHADTLRNQQEPNIDDLLNIVTESVGAYKVCKERIDAVEKALEQALGNVGVESVPVTPTAYGSQKVDTADDGDIPF